jgi:hypothetical protein
MSATYSENNKGLNNKAKRLIVTKRSKIKHQEVAQNACHRLQCKLQHTTGDFQDAEYLFVAGFLQVGERHL